MKNIKHIFIAGLLAMLFSCGQSDTENKKVALAPKNQIEDSLHTAGKATQCNFDQILTNPQTPESAKKLFNRSAKHTKVSLTYFDSLKSANKETREFYFRVITNSYAIADRDYDYASELGHSGKEYIESNPKDFAAFFDNKNCFTDTDLTAWAKIVLFEFRRTDKNIETGKDEPLVNGYCRKLITNSLQYPDSQKETVKNFCDLLLHEWKDFLKSID